MLTYECIVCPPVGQDVKETKLKSDLFAPRFGIVL